MAYEMIELTREPIWLLQDNETPKQCYFLSLYIQSGMDLPTFIKSFQIKDENDEIQYLKQGDTWDTNGGQNKKQIVLLFNPPNSPRTFRNWYHYRKWEERCTAYWADTIKKAHQSNQELAIKFFNRDIKNTIKSADNDWNTDNEINYDYSTKPHLKAKGKNDLASAHQKKIEIICLQSGMPKDISKQQSDMNIKSDITFSDKSNELFTDELKDYNIDDAYDEVTEDVDN